MRHALRLGVLMALVVPAVSACGGQQKSATGGGGAPTNGQIVFRRWLDQTHSAIFTMNPDGSHVDQITHPPNGWRGDFPEWSRDGTKAVFEGSPEEPAGFVVGARFHEGRADVHAQQRQGATSLCNPSLASELL